MLEDFKRHLSAVCCCSLDQSYLVAVSGGIDSVVMTHLFKASGLKFSLAHCNFHLRGEESLGDQDFVEVLADKMQLKLHVKSFDTAGEAGRLGISIQMAARDLRYNWFRELAREYGYNFIAVGHNKNDAVETLLLNLSRGTGIRGLTGIRPRNGNIIRPILFADRALISNYASHQGLSWREDSSNSEIKYHRNNIRHTIIPAFETINPAFVQNALDTASRLEQTERLLDFVLAQVKKSVWTVLPDRYLIDMAKLMEYPAVETLLFELLREFGVNQPSLDSILSSFGSAPGKQFYTRTHCITRDRSHLIITGRISPMESEISIGSETAHTDYPVKLNFSKFEAVEGYKIPSDRCYAVLDADKMTYPLKIRIWKEGDRFFPLGLKGSKKISDFLINIKIALPDKKHVWVLETAGKIAWVINHRIDDRFRITGRTHNILLIEYKE